jgi:ACS family hexuronate transporter-like MFS transporter
MLKASPSNPEPASAETSPAAAARSGWILPRSWIVLLLLGATGFLFRFDRQVFSILKSTMSLELGLSNTDYSLLVAGFMLPFTVGFLLAGHVVDRWGTQRTLWLFIIGMSLSTVALGLVRNFSGLLAARIALGVAAAGVMPAVLVAVTQWFPVERRTTAFTVQSALHNCGAILAPPLVAGLSLLAGWPAAFIVPGLVGLGIALALRMADAGAPFMPDAGTLAPPTAAWRTMLQSRPLRLLILARMCGDPFWFFLFYWQSAYLQERVGLSLADLGTWTWIPPAFSVAATLVLGSLNDRMIRAGRPPLLARLRLLGAITLAAPVTLLLPWLQDPVASVAALTLVYAMCNAWLLLTNMIVTDIMPPGSVGTAFGLVSACGGLTSIVFNLVSGPLIDAVGHTVILTFGALLHPCAWLVVRRLASDPAAKPAGAPGG